MQSIILRRSLLIWYLMPIMVVIGLHDWHQFLGDRHLHLIGLPIPYTYRRGGGMLMLPLAVIATGYDLFARFIRRDRLEFSENGIGDYASSDRLGEIHWSAVDGVAINRKLLGTAIIIHFKEGEPLNDRVESWDRIIIGSLAISDRDMAGISAMLRARKIPGGDDVS